MSIAVLEIKTISGAPKRRASPLSNTYADSLRVLTARLLQTQEDEKRRIGRELHDGIIQKLASIEVDLELFRQSRENWPEDLDAQLTALRRSAAELSEDLRGLCHRMHPALLEHFGLSTALRVYCSRFEQHEGIGARFITDSFQIEDKDLELALYRIAQEALQNVRKHSGATLTEVHLEQSGNDVLLRIRDNGRGFTPEKRRGSGIGLVSMEERARLAGGDCLVESTPGEGTTICVRVPMSRVSGSDAPEEAIRTTLPNRRSARYVTTDSVNC